jgi:predicted transcriptional regulator
MQMRSPRLFLRGLTFAREFVQPALGPLESRVMDLLWRGGEASVRGVRADVGTQVAYTTVMTTLDRLFKKGLLTRRKIGRAFHYEPAASREECERRQAAALVEGLIEHHRQAPLPLLSNLVEAVGEQDGTLLDELERLVQEKRAQLRNGGAL